MSGHGAPSLDAQAPGAKVAVVASSWHTQVMDGLIAGATARLDAADCLVELYRVPGSFELPLGCQAAIDAGYDAVVALGVIIRGGTPHFEYVSSAATNGLAQVSLSSGVPVGFGLLTCDDEAQAIDRAGLPGSSEDKGREAAEAVLGMLSLLRRLA